MWRDSASSMEFVVPSRSAEHFIVELSGVETVV